MTTKPKKICLGLQEQVEYNKLNIEKHYEINRVIASIGFNFEGVVATEEDLPANYTGEIGDAYAVGTYPDYVYYIWSRANPALNEPTNYWFKFGPLVLKGDPGESTRWYSFETDDPSILNTIEEPKIGDMALLGNGSIYTYTHTPATDLGWYFVTNIKGPKGDTTDWTVVEVLLNTTAIKPAGDMLLEGSTGKVYRSDGVKWMYQASIKGNQGEPGKRGLGIVILGKVQNTQVLSLISPDSVRRDGGYIVGEGSNSSLYAITGGTPDNPELQWELIGPYSSLITPSLPDGKLYKHSVFFDYQREEGVVFKCFTTVYTTSATPYKMENIHQFWEDNVTLNVNTSFWLSSESKMVLIQRIEYNPLHGYYRSYGLKFNPGSSPSYYNENAYVHYDQPITSISDKVTLV